MTRLTVEEVFRLEFNVSCWRVSSGLFLITLESPVWGSAIIPTYEPQSVAAAKCLRVLAQVDGASLGVKLVYGRLNQLSKRLDFFVASSPLPHR